MFNTYSSFIESHPIILLVSLFVAWKLNRSYFKSVQTFFYKATGFRYGFCKTTLLTFMGTLFILYSSHHGIAAFAVLLITLRILWLFELAAMTLETIE